MKKLLLVCLLLCSVTVWAQKKEVTFQVRFSPNTAYANTVSTSSKMVLNFEGAPEVLAEIEKEVALPLVIESRNDIVTTINTGALREDKSMPATIVYGKAISTSKNNGKETVVENPVSGLIAKGSYSGDSKFVIDTLISDKLTAELENTIRYMLENVQNQIVFPADPMKVGDSFEQRLPMSMPVAGAEPINMLIITNYKLKNIKGNLAHFDIDQAVQLGMVAEGTDITASGTGTGSSEFDIKNSFITKYESDLQISLTADVNEVKIITSVNTQTKQHVKIN